MNCCDFFNIAEAIPCGLAGLLHTSQVGLGMAAQRGPGSAGEPTINRESIGQDVLPLPATLNVCRADLPQLAAVADHEARSELLVQVSLFFRIALAVDLCLDTNVNVEDLFQNNTDCLATMRANATAGKRAPSAQYTIWHQCGEPAQRRDKLGLQFCRHLLQHAVHDTLHHVGRRPRIKAFWNG